MEGWQRRPYWDDFWVRDSTIRRLGWNIIAHVAEITGCIVEPAYTKYMKKVFMIAL